MSIFHRSSSGSLDDHDAIWRPMPPARDAVRAEAGRDEQAATSDSPR
jgi:hypothetical protein